MSHLFDNSLLGVLSSQGFFQLESLSTWQVRYTKLQLILALKSFGPWSNGQEGLIIVLVGIWGLFNHTNNAIPIFLGCFTYQCEGFHIISNRSKRS